MKALILSGGKGTRLRPITHTGAKQLIPVANKPILFYAIESIIECGITDVGIIVGETAAEIKEAVGDGSNWGAKVTYIQQDEPLGLAHAVKIARDFLKDDPFVMFLGDNLIKDGIKPLVEEFKRDKPNSQILLAQVKHPEQFGVASLKDDKVVLLEEKPVVPKSDLALVGVYMFDHNVFKAIAKIKPSKRGELEITDAIQMMIDDGYDVCSHIIQGWWKDTGKLTDMLEANRIILSDIENKIEGEIDSNSQIDGQVVIAPGARIINSTIRGPVVIGENTEIINSYVGPFTSIYYGVRIENSEVEHSIILEESAILNLPGRMEDSLIGRKVMVAESKEKPKAYRFMLGDYSQVGV